MGVGWVAAFAVPSPSHLWAWRRRCRCVLNHLGVDRCRKTALFRQLAGGTGDFSGQSRISWSAPHLVDTGQAARLTIRRACSCANLAGLRYPSAEWSRLLL